MNAIVRIALPWPDRALHPNARSHWRTVASAKKKARADAYILAIDAGARSARVDKESRLALQLDFRPPNRCRRDLDGCVSSMKAALDGIADALGIDDARFFEQSAEMLEPVKGGCVIVTILRV